MINIYFKNLMGKPMYNKASNINALNTVDFTEETVHDKLCKLRADKSPGVDGIHPVVSCKFYFQAIESHF